MFTAVNEAGTTFIISIEACGGYVYFIQVHPVRTGEQRQSESRQSKSRVPVLTTKPYCLFIALTRCFQPAFLRFWLVPAMGLRQDHHNHPRRFYPTHGFNIPFKVNMASSKQVMQTFLLHFPLCNYPLATAWFQIPVHESQFGAKQGWMHEILEIIREIPFPPRFTAIISLIMNCSSVLPALEVIASAGSNHFVQLPQLSIPFRMIGI